MAHALDPDVGAALVGASAQVRHHVTAGDTAATLGSGDLPILGTPRMIALMEDAACRALLGHLPPRFTTVGSRIDIRHVRPTPVGVDVVAYAEVVEVSDARLTYAVRANQIIGDEETQIGTGTHVRVIVEREAFLEAL